MISSQDGRTAIYFLLLVRFLFILGGYITNTARAMSFTAIPGVQVVAMPSVESLRPDAVYYEISFPSTALDLQCIQFQNYYAASLVIKQKVHGKFEFVAIEFEHLFSIGRLASGI